MPVRLALLSQSQRRPEIHQPARTLVATHCVHSGGASGWLRLRNLGYDYVGRQESARNRCGILQRAADDFGWVNNTGCKEVLVLVGCGVVSD